MPVMMTKRGAGTDAADCSAGMLPSALLGLEPPLVRRENAELLPVLGYRAPRDSEALPAQDLGDLLVRQRLAPVLGGHEVPDVLLDGDGGDHLAGVRGDAAVEEVLELEKPLGCLHVLVGGDAADGGLVHADVLAHVPERQRPQVGHAPVEEVALELHEALGHLAEGALALLDTLDEPDGG